MLGTILVIEDHEAMRKLLREWIEMIFPQYEVIEAGDAETGIATAQSCAPRVAVVDINLPEMNGIEATRQIKASMPAVQVVVLTIHEDEVHRADALAAGARAYVPKRTMQTEFITVLEEILLPAPGAHGAAVVSE